MSNGIEDPDVTPMININLVILVMVLTIASHAAKLLPLKLPEGRGKTVYIRKEKTVPLVVKGDGFAIGGKTLDKAGLMKELSNMNAGEILLVEVQGGDYEKLTEAIDCIMKKNDIKVCFGNMIGKGGGVAGGDKEKRK